MHSVHRQGTSKGAMRRRNKFLIEMTHIGLDHKSSSHPSSYCHSQAIQRVDGDLPAKHIAPDDGSKAGMCTSVPATAQAQTTNKSIQKRKKRSLSSRGLDGNRHPLGLQPHTPPPRGRRLRDFRRIITQPDWPATAVHSPRYVPSARSDRHVPHAMRQPTCKHLHRPPNDLGYILPDHHGKSHIQGTCSSSFHDGLARVLQGSGRGSRGRVKVYERRWVRPAHRKKGKPKREVT